jgi:hypothetical protein
VKRVRLSLVPGATFAGGVSSAFIRSTPLISLIPPKALVVVDVAELAHKPMPAWEPRRYTIADLERARDRVEAMYETALRARDELPGQIARAEHALRQRRDGAQFLRRPRT